MKFAFYPGCVARGATPELLTSTVAVCDRLGIELDFESMRSASCTGSGILQEKNLRLGDTLNARNFALAEKVGLDILTICSTCQGIMSQAVKRLNADAAYLAEINADLAEEGLEYTGASRAKHLLWVVVEEVGLERLKAEVKMPLTGFRAAPFYGCYMVRPSDALGFDEHPERQDSLERVIEAVGAEPVDFPGKTACCGFPILMINEANSVKMVANHTLDAKDRGADAMVTPCPLCHLNLDGYQPQASAAAGKPIDLPILHLPQMLGLAMGISPDDLKVNRHIVSTKALLSKVAVAS